MVLRVNSKQNFYNFLFEYLTNKFQLSETDVAGFLSVFFYEKYGDIFFYKTNIEDSLSSYDFYEKRLHEYVPSEKTNAWNVTDCLVKTDNEEFKVVSIVVEFAAHILGGLK